MKMPTCTTLFTLIFIMNATIFLVTRVLLFSENYSLGKRIKNEHERFAHMCMTHADLREIEPQRCQQRTVAAEMSPWVYSLKQVAVQTPSCGYAHCSDIYGAILDKSSSALFNITLGMGVFVIFYSVLIRIVGPLLKPSTDTGNYYNNSLEHGGPPLRVLNENYNTQYQPSNIQLLPRKRLQTAADFSE